MPHPDTPSRLNSLLKETAWYTAAAGAVIGLTASEAHAQIIYTDVDPDVTVMNDAPPSVGFEVNFDGDDDIELSFNEMTVPTWPFSRQRADDGPDNITGIIGNIIPFGNNSYAYHIPLSAGSPISSGAPDFITISAYPNQTFTYAGADPNGFIAAGDTFIGLQFVTDAATTHNAWVNVEVTAGAITIKGYAYELTPDAPINAGDITTAIEPGPDGLPGTHNLSAVFPNPFNPQARFTLEVAEQQSVRIVVYDALGREVATLHDGALGAGSIHEFQIDGANLPSGVYVVRAIGEQFTDVRQVTLTK